MAQQPRRILRAHAEHVLHQLLRNGARAARTTQHGILRRTRQAAEVDAVVVVEPLVLSSYQRFEENGVYLLVGHIRAVLLVDLADELTVGAVDLRGLGVARVHDVVERGRLAEKPQEVSQHGYDVECQQHYKRQQPAQQPAPPRT